MNTKRALLLAVIAVIGALLLFISNDIKHPVLEQKVPVKKWESKLNAEGAVVIEITPIKLSPKDREWKFEVVLNTHSVELDQDMAAISKLLDDKGNQYDLLYWQGDPPGGHHREVMLTFKPIIPTPKYIELRILNVDVLVRSYVWDISG
ncbi:MAG: hypothetical protein A3H52_02195 [Candidatus Zambryskibacteria bacterium RIFCSPLOWO2_02_FULL_39_26]|uniref:DUF4352 domain-containing protein n=1 Tax=Candidatus Zambryskibacteria bacterium RIFCSPLOWO2_12_FULL_39_23 TaxID=1802776 RepID=A0A1G2URH0_9BACT|nr:MAG: hypothetical protein A2W51_01020 [Candidatus Zambryskibacteria bacterium RIFCSPHIGHO2_02_39_10]OHA98816.1 MAG: hypothetical protein A3E59_00645 [Candidatus Zambryskibacteria bacterium RIFCSPHIGHO2_12_FULL_39_47]OHB09400.1 MAG: hypothetical protein A3H52_02195 [Candidatus Zambryskibacteria bacterium RIFCSPLOWO2_02_FULL_39_26]OHB11984.1 MAG: hypothetical protein A3G99_02780 [Candidatus Zambryskibacteria bacterium RIFCSPLOWO2_12_FULL_39_23]